MVRPIRGLADHHRRRPLQLVLVHTLDHRARDVAGLRGTSVTVRRGLGRVGRNLKLWRHRQGDPSRRLATPLSELRSPAPRTFGLRPQK